MDKKDRIETVVIWFVAKWIPFWALNKEKFELAYQELMNQQYYPDEDKPLRVFYREIETKDDDLVSHCEIEEIPCVKVWKHGEEPGLHNVRFAPWGFTDKQFKTWAEKEIEEFNKLKEEMEKEKKEKEEQEAKEKE